MRRWDIDPILFVQADIRQNHLKTNPSKATRVPSEDLDQHGHLLSLVYLRSVVYG